MIIILLMLIFLNITIDTVHDLTGLYSVYTHWRSIEIMFHVSTQLPYEKHDSQKLQRKRHIGNDIVCVVFLEADNTTFSPACIKSHFLHTFILVRITKHNTNTHCQSNDTINCALFNQQRYECQPE